MKKNLKRAGAALCALAISMTIMVPTNILAAGSGNYYQDNFQEQYDKMTNSSNGYFSKQGIPYHSVETLMVEAPDYGHESTSETASYYVWLEAMKGKFTGDFSGVNKAWDIIEKYYIPTHADQPAMSTYKKDSPATYAPEWETPNQYPAQMDFQKKVGKDPISDDLRNAYGTDDMYGMHWLIDVDNWYGYGSRADGTSTPSYINTFQRGEQESCWETVPQPCWDMFKFGGRNGYLDLFTGDSQYSRQFKYTDAPDADARVIQATYDANKWAKQQGKSIGTATSKASKIGDYLRYAMFDKYFMKVGDSKTPGTGYDAAHYLMSWYYAWGGDVNSGWSWKIGASHNHQAYQSPMAAWILSTNSDFKPKSANGASDWAKSLDRQMEFYQWLQTSEGAIAGGASNSWNGRYESVPAGTSTFYGMGYQPHPVYHDPVSNRWFGFQVWPMQRLAEYYYESKDARAKEVITKWANWAVTQVTFDDTNHTFQIPINMEFDGQPDTWTGKSTGNPNLHVKVYEYGMDVGVAGSLANTLAYAAAANNDTEMQKTVKKMLDYMAQYKDDKGIAVAEKRGDYLRFNDPVYIPSNWTGTMPNGDPINSNSTFLSIRSKYKQDPQWSKVEAALSSGTAPELTYHRFWSQADVALAYGTYAILFPTDTEAGWKPGDTVLLGDVTGDGEINALDFATLKKYLLDPTIAINKTNADINKDGEVNALDFAALKGLLLKGN